MEDPEVVKLTAAIDTATKDRNRWQMRIDHLAAELDAAVTLSVEIEKARDSGEPSANGRLEDAVAVCKAACDKLSHAQAILNAKVTAIETARRELGDYLMRK